MLSRISVKKPVTVIMITLIFIIFGVVSFTNLSTSLMPSIDLPIGVVSVVYPGASPEEMETVVSAPVESTIETVENVKSIQSISSEFSSIIIIEFNDGTDIDMAMIEVREKLDLIWSRMPDGVNDPMTMKFNPDMMPIMAISVTQDGESMLDVTDFVNKVVKSRLERQEGVAQVTINGGETQYIEIVLDSDKVELLGLNREAISGILFAQNFNFPAGNIEEDGKNYTLRTSSEFTSVEDIEDTVLMQVPVIKLPDGSQLDKFDVFKIQKQMMTQMADGNNVDPTQMDPTMLAAMMVFSDLDNAEMQPITLGDFATINFVSENENVYTKVNGENAVTLSMQKQTDINTSDVVANIYKEIEAIKKDYPGTEFTILLDQAEYINQMVGNISMNGLIGGILAIVILFVFLKDLRPTIVIGIAIPISIIVAFSAIYFTGITLNIVSMGGLALGIGMLVDNSVVVLENIYRLRKEGMKRAEAAIQGAHQVAGAIVASTLTTVAVFMPVVFVQGFTADMFKEMALTVSITLLASLLVSLTLVPMLSSKLIRKPDTSTHHKLMDKTRDFYSKVLRGAIKHKGKVIILTVAISASSMALVGTVGGELMPQTDEGIINVTVKMPKGTIFNDTVEEVKKVENYLLTLDAVDIVSTQVGGGDAMMRMFLGGGNDSGSISVTLVDVGERKDDTKAIADQIRNHVVNLTDAEVTVEASSGNMMSMGTSGISYNIMGDDFDVLETLAADLSNRLSQIEGVVEIEDGISKGSPELTIQLIEEEALPKGVTTAGVAQEINSLLSGVKSTSINVDGLIMDIYVNESDNTEINLNSVKDIVFKTPYGTEVALKDVATFEPTEGYTSINRKDQRRTLNVTAKLEEGYDIGSVTSEINKAIDEMNIPEGYIIDESGEAEQMAESFKTLGLALLLGGILVYMIMASQFESLIYPFVIVFSVLFAFSGAFITLFLTGTPLSIVSMLGLIVLTGIVVNNGIVLVDYINKLKEEGKSTFDAIMEAGPTRLRPIFMTALTTILALLPIALGFGEGSEMMTPLGLVVVGGLSYSTILTLVIVPSMYALVDGIKSKFKKSGVDHD
ncbi:MAG: efflux RND transporter permease subunit [Clostridia bacterium]|nr:efflux RND transporter permease subunit [Clostridia bacterium]